MRARASIFAIALCALAAACGSSSSNRSSATGGSGGSGTGGSGGSGTGGSGGTTQTSSVQGAVWTYLSDQSATVPNATVAVLGSSLSTTSDASGAFSFANVPNGEHFFTVDVVGYWGTVDYWDVPDETNSGFALYVIPDAAVSSMATQLGRNISTQDGMVEVYFYPAVSGATATLDPPNHDPPFTLDEDGDIKVQNTTIATNEEADLFFTPVPAGGTITASVQGPSGSTCQVIQSDTGSFPIRAKSVSVVYATCH